MKFDKDITKIKRVTFFWDTVQNVDQNQDRLGNSNTTDAHSQVARTVRLVPKPKVQIDTFYITEKKTFDHFFALQRALSGGGSKTKTLRPRPRPRPVWDRFCRKTAVPDHKSGNKSTYKSN